MATGRFFPVQTLHLGPTGSFATFNEAALPLGGQLGMIVEDAGKVYRLVKFDNGAGNVASVAGAAAYWKTRGSTLVTSDLTDQEAGVNSVAGGFLGVVTDLSYCFIQIGGAQSVSTAASVVAGDKLIGGGTADGQLVRAAAATAAPDIPVAIAYGSVSGGFTPVYWLLGILL